MVRLVRALPALAVMGLLGGCAVAPSYEDVKADTINAGEEIIATFPALSTSSYGRTTTRIRAVRVATCTPDSGSSRYRRALTSLG